MLHTTNSIQDFFDYGFLQKEESMYLFDWVKAAGLIFRRKPFEAYAATKEDKYLIYREHTVHYPEAVIMSIEQPLLLMDDDEPIQCGIREYKTSVPVWNEECIRILNNESTEVSDDIERTGICDEELSQ